MQRITYKCGYKYCGVYALGQTKDKKKVGDIFKCTFCGREQIISEINGDDHFILKYLEEE